jgi:long-chain acyl-CoA synthetase
MPGNRLAYDLQYPMSQLATATVDVRTLADLPFLVAEDHPRPARIRRCVGERFEDVSSVSFLERIRAFSLGLQDLGLARGDRIGMVCESRPEWSIGDFAILTAGGITVPVYPTLSVSQARFILQDAGASLVLVSDEVQAAKVLEVADELPSLRAVVLLAPGPAYKPGERTPVPVLLMADVEATGRRRLEDEPGLDARYRAGVASIASSDTATIIYTSGTTGEPKGVILSHDNLLSNLVAGNDVLKVSDADLALSFLPLSHVFERLALYVFLYAGATVVFAESLQTVARDLERVAPTVMTGVPRVYEKYHSAVLETIGRAPAWRQRLFRWAVNVGDVMAKARSIGRRPSWVARLQAPLADKLILAKVRARTGGRVRVFASGSAPLSRTTAEFFFAVGMPITEGYGLTETSPVLTLNAPELPRIGTVGKPVRGVEIRIAEDGEILARGPNIMQGYYNRPEETAAAIRDGWFHTGDVGCLDAEGHLAITDRKKDLIVTSGGKNIAPQPIEQRIKQSPLVAEAVLIGDRRSFPAALIIPNFAELRTRLGEAVRHIADHQVLLQRADVQALYQTLIDTINVELAQFERIKRFAVLPTEVTVEGGELTPTMKLRRRIVEERWGAVIEQLYSREAVPAVS